MIGVDSLGDPGENFSYVVLRVLLPKHRIVRLATCKSSAGGRAAFTKDAHLSRERVVEGVTGPSVRI